MKTIIVTLSVVASLLTGMSSARASSVEQNTQDVVKTYFDAFAVKDSATMGSLYQEETQDIFMDPVFTPALNTQQVRKMWKLLLLAATNFSVDYKINKINGSLAFVSWTATYNFSETGQKVVNHGSTAMKVVEGKIAQQTDHFNLCDWFQMALPPQQADVLCLKPDLFRVGIRKKLGLD